MTTIRVFSFDVFDTCLVRTEAAPTDLFYDLAAGLLGPRDQNTREALHELAQARVEAEQRARLHSDREDITIHAVYEHFPELQAWGLDPEQAKALELELELAAVRPVLAIRKRIDQARANGGRVIFISDMYLPPETIGAMLEQHGLRLPEEHLYVSGQIGVCKGSGRLFDHVLEREGIAPGEMLHSGDNLHSDIAVPEARGIGTAPYHGHRFNRYELEMLHGSEAPNRLRSALAGTSRAVRLKHTAPEDPYHGLLSIAAGVAAPLLTSFVAWVLEDAGRQGVEKLFFISRDGQIFYRIAQALSRHLDDPPELHYIYGSRQAWYLPSVFNVDRESLDWIAIGAGGHSRAPRTVLKHLKLEPEQIASQLERFGFERSSWDRELEPEQLERFWELLLDPQTADAILEQSNDARSLMIDYLAQEGFEPGRSALVDMGWSLRSQAAVRKVLGRENDQTLWGYYLGIFRWHLPMHRAGGYRAFFLETLDDDRRPDSPLGRMFPAYYPLLLEHVFTMCDHPSVSGYRRDSGRLMPEYAGSELGPQMRETVTRFQSVVVDYADEIGRHRLPPEHLGQQKESAGRGYLKFITRPTREEAAAIAWMEGVVDQVHAAADYTPLARPLKPGDIYYVAKKQLGFAAPADLRELGFSWEEGSLALSSPAVRLTYRLIHHALRHYAHWRGRLRDTAAAARGHYRRRLPLPIRQRLASARHKVRRALT